jgi:hypothetical protein
VQLRPQHQGNQVEVGAVGGGTNHQHAQGSQEGVVEGGSLLYWEGLHNQEGEDLEDDL